MQKEVNQLQKNVTDLTLSANARDVSQQALNDKIVQLAATPFLASDKLKKLTEDLNTALVEFKSKAGVSYDEAMQYRQAK